MRAIISFCSISAAAASSAEDVLIALDWESSGRGPGVEVVSVGPGSVCGSRLAVAGDVCGIVDVDASNLGRNVELISPIPTKKSSVWIY